MASASLAHGSASAAGMSASSFKARRAPAIATLRLVADDPRHHELRARPLSPFA